jgi:hypothetical protein
MHRDDFNFHSFVFYEETFLFFQHGIIIPGCCYYVTINNVLARTAVFSVYEKVSSS